MADAYDAIIIGAGLSGLAAGIRLAYFDKRVCILERHTTIGGLNSFYRLRDRNYDVGLHAVTNFASRGAKRGPLIRVLRQLRFDFDDFGLAPQLESSVLFPGCGLRFSNDFELLRGEIAARFPHQTAGFDRLAKTAGEFDLADFGRVRESARAVVAEHITDPLLAEMLFCPIMFYSSATPHDIDFGLFAVMFKSIFLEGLGRPWAGVRPILKTLTRRYKSLGGELRLRSGVRAISTDGSRAQGVLLDDGEVVTAGHVLSSAGLVETMRMCQPPQPAAETCEPGRISFFEAIFILDRPPREFGFDRTIAFYNDTDRFRYEPSIAPVDVRSGIVCSPNNFDYDTPLPDNRIRITALADPQFWMGLPEDDYQAHKQECIEHMAASATRFLPDFLPYVVETDSFTPRTIRKFTGHINGCVYGAPTKLADGRTDVQNLYVCGTDQGFLGIVGAMVSGISIANYCVLN